MEDPLDRRSAVLTVHKMSRLVEFFASDDPDEAQKSSLVDFFEKRGTGRGQG